MAKIEKIEKEVEDVKETKDGIIPGKYTCDKPLRVVKELTFRNKQNKDGSIARTFGTWVKPENFWYFGPNKAVELKKEDLENPSIKQLILNGTLRRTL